MRASPRALVGHMTDKRVGHEADKTAGGDSAKLEPVELPQCVGRMWSRSCAGLPWAMSSHRDDADVFAAEKTWRELAARADYDPVVAARLLKMSLRQLERKCQRLFGCPPRQWFQRERMTRAGLLLAAGQSAKSIALELGYSQLANFSRDFKHHHGRCPTAFAPRPDPFTAFLAVGKSAR